MFDPESAKKAESGRNSRPFFTAGAKDYPPTLSAARPEVKELTNLLAALAQARQKPMIAPEAQEAPRGPGLGAKHVRLDPDAIVKDDVVTSLSGQVGHRQAELHGPAQVSGRSGSNAEGAKMHVQPGIILRIKVFDPESAKKAESGRNSRIGTVPYHKMHLLRACGQDLVQRIQKPAGTQEHAFRGPGIYG